MEAHTGKAYQLVVVNENQEVRDANNQWQAKDQHVS
jgi:hypothetical protein